MATDLEAAHSTRDEQIESTDTLVSGDSVVLRDVSWKMYRKLRKMPGNYNIRMTYDRGELEIMSPSMLHESIAALLGRLIDVWTLELGIPIRSCRTMTIRRAALQRGFEPDNCYYVQHEPEMWDKTKINFKNDPPPDLAIEVDVSRKLSDKLNIYAAFRVPELWHWSGGKLAVLELSKDGQYAARETSVCFPEFPIAKAEELVRQLGKEHETVLLSSFRDWVRQNAQPAG